MSTSFCDQEVVTTLLPISIKETGIFHLRVVNIFQIQIFLLRITKKYEIIKLTQYVKVFRVILNNY